MRQDGAMIVSKNISVAETACLFGVNHFHSLNVTFFYSHQHLKQAVTLESPTRHQDEENNSSD